eukprot:1826630-Pleurochrysis_carterae.AAC.3
MLYCAMRRCAGVAKALRCRPRGLGGALAEPTMPDARARAGAYRGGAGRGDRRFGSSLQLGFGKALVKMNYPLTRAWPARCRCVGEALISLRAWQMHVHAWTQMHKAMHTQAVKLMSELGHAHPHARVMQGRACKCPPVGAHVCILGYVSRLNYARSNELPNSIRPKVNANTAVTMPRHYLPLCFSRV